MKRITFLMTGLLVLMLACDNPVNVPEDAPDVFRELVETGDRIDESKVNAHVYGSFSITFGDESEVILDDEGNFPGNPKNAGYCRDGLWSNPKGKETSGSIDKPHPHCVRGSESVIVILEPISVDHEIKTTGPGNETLNFSKKNFDVKAVGGDPGTNGKGIIIAYAIDADTISDPEPRRVGTLTIDLNDYTDKDNNLFLDGCTMGEVGDEDYFTTESRCLNKIISANYEPYGDDSVGIPRENIQGFLYWTPASQPFNY